MTEDIEIYSGLLYKMTVLLFPHSTQNGMRRFATSKLARFSNFPVG